MALDLKDKGPLIIAAVLVLVAIVMYSRQAPSTSIGANIVQPNNSSTDAANAQIAAANASSAGSYEQVIAQEFEQMVGLGAKIQDNMTAVQEANIASKTQIETATLATQQAEKIAALEAQTMQTQYNDQLQAAKTQSNNQTKSNIFGDFFGAIASIF